MNKIKQLALASATAAAFLVAGGAQADLLEYSFTSAQGEQRTLKPSATYANPTGNIKFALSAGVDRMVRVSIVNTAGNVLSSQTSKLLGANDRITVDGREYYGAFLSLAAPAEGAYTLRAEILSAGNKPVAVDDYEWVVDTTPPTASAMETTNGGHTQVTTGDTWKLGTQGSERTYFRVDNVVDASPIAGADVWVYRADGSLHLKRRANFDKPSGRVELYNKDLFPSSNLDEAFKVQVTIKDVAGNTLKLPSQTVYYDNYTAAPTQPFGVYDPDSSNILAPGLNGYVPYVAGMEVKVNPIRLAYRIPRNNWHQYHEGGLTLINMDGDSRAVGSDSQYVYVVYSGPFYPGGSVVGDQARWRNFSAWGGGSITYNLKLSPQAHKTPAITKLEYRYNDKGWMGQDRYIKNSELPIVNEGVRVTVEPRNYPQVISHRGMCSIPAGQTQCEINVNQTISPGTNGVIRTSARAMNAEGTLSSNMVFPYVTWNDRYYPELTYSYNEQEKEVTVFVTQEGAGSYHNRLRLSETWLQSSDGTKLNPSGGKTEAQDKLSTYKWDLKTLPEGTFNLVVVAKENHGPETRLPLFEFFSDRTAPEMTIKNTGSASVSSLDQFLIEISDSYDPDPQITGIQLKGGPAADDVQLAWRKVTDRNYALEYPIVFPSMAAGETYTLTVTAQDAHGNTVTKTSSFMYEPRQINLADGMDGKLMIPAVTHDFKRIDGGHVIQTAPIELANGVVVSGTYDVLATLRSDAKVPLVVNGVRIEPGQTMSVMSQHDFSTSDGRVNLSLSPAVAGVEGSSGLLVMTTAPNSPVLVLDVNTWIGKANISAEKWEVRQVIDALNITASPELGVACRITSDEKKAKESDIIRDPVCLLEWDEMPDEAVPVESKSGELILTSLGGQAVALGEQPVSYSLYLYSGDGQKVWVGSGRETINVVSALGSVSYEPARDVNTVHRVIEEIEMRMRQRLGPNCRPTLDAGQAQASAAARSTGALSTTCLFEWIEVPDGLQQDSYSDTPYLFGSLREKDDYKLHWRVSIYSKAGSRITLASESYEIAAIDPPLPEISMDTRYRFSDDLYMVPMDGGHIGDALIQGELTPLDIGVMRDSEVLTNETFTPGRVGAKNRVFRRLLTEPMNMWDETQFKIDGAYTLLPEVSQSKTFRAVAVPNSSIAPQIDAGVTQALDSEPLPVKVRMINRLDLNGEYNADTMGLWSVRLGREDGPGNIVPMTDYTEATNGEVEFQIDLSGIDRSVRLVAEARLHSPVEGYERIEKSQRLFLAVLRGGAIDADVISRRLSGPAPLITVLQLGIDDWIDRSVTGDVTWQVSADDGATWEEYLQTDRNKFRWSTSFEHGSYLVRAHVKNMHSGAESMTETVEVVAYHKARGVIVGDQTIFAGTTATYEAQVTDGSGEPMDDALVQWTLDKGETFIQDGATLEISSEEPVRHRMEAWVRDPTAPEDDPYAYTKLRATADFRKIKGPGVYLNGPRVIEVGETYEYTARLNPPYRGMSVEMLGEFVLPSGERVSGTSVTYTPTEEDLEVGHVRLGYEAWVEGYRDEGTLAGRDLRARVWKYVWPNWALSVQSNAKVAPVEVSARARMLSFRGRLESPEYEWEIEGPGIGNVVDRWADMRTLTIVEPGTYTFRVTVKDGRDHETVMEETLEVGEANPYEVNISYTTSNEYMRAPLDIRMRPQIGGGHPRDRAQEYVYSINGERIESVGYGAGTTLEAGTHELSLFVMTRMGEELIETITLEVAANEPPVCEIVTEDRSSTWRLNAVCEDTDGRMRGYEWTINGEPVTVRSNRLTIPKSAHDNVLPLVQLIGYDDAGGYSDPVLAD